MAGWVCGCALCIRAWEWQVLDKRYEQRTKVHKITKRKEEIIAAADIKLFSD
jgi:hypothetical protein